MWTHFITRSLYKPFFLLWCLLFWVPGNAMATAPCSIANSAGPPFLSIGNVDPNLLLIIDNSASMYDMAYLKPENHCFDDTYTNYNQSDETTWYAGYFQRNGYYEYDSAAQQFTEITQDSFNSNYSGSGVYTAPDVKVQMYAGPSDTTVFNIKSRGNFLNWTTASKFDIQKNILTGGKYENTQLVLEGRGCSGSRFAKQAAVKDNAAVIHYLVMAVHPNGNTVDPFYVKPFPTLDDEITIIDILQITTGGFQIDACQATINEMADPNTSLGRLSGLISDCLEYGHNQSYTNHENPAYNQAIQNCWYADKHGWADNIQHTSSIRNQCEPMYEDYPDPADIPSSTPGYVCSQQYVGRCWQKAVGIGSCLAISCDDTTVLGDNPKERCQSGIVEYCSGNYNANQNTCNKPWVPKCADGTEGTITPGYWYEGEDPLITDIDGCVDQALIDFCDIVKMPEVIDPTDLTTATGEVWNMPAMIIDSGISGQLGDVKAQLVGKIAKSAAPTGLLDEFSEGIRIGAMKFNNAGSKSECFVDGSPILYACQNISDDKDGGKIVAEIADPTPFHTTTLKTAINNIKADAWTPLAETMYSAVAYYTGRSGLLDPNFDLGILAPAFPVTESCQSNNIMIITEGASTADQNPTMTTFADAVLPEENFNCGSLYGSTYLDDLTYYAARDEHLFDTLAPDGDPYQNIKTYFVVAGTPRTEGLGECSPQTLMEEAAANGRTGAPYIAKNPDELENRLREIFNIIRGGASAGSAASVISATRSGEGAVYQAIFWPKTIGSDNNDVFWTGEVHGLFLGADGAQYEDTNRNGRRDENDNRVMLFFDENVDPGRTRACYGTLSEDGFGTISCSGAIVEMNEVKYVWSAAEWLANVNNIKTNRNTYISADVQRYIFTWNDLNNDGIVDHETEIIPFEETTQWTQDAFFPAGRNPVYYDFAVDNITGTTEEDKKADAENKVNEIVNYVRGEDQPGLRPRQVPIDTANFDIYEPGDYITANEYLGHTETLENITWRLGDIIYSTPTAVSRPAEGYHLLYKDRSYAAFVNHYSNRRTVIYVGGNDGMIHAFNGGFYNKSTSGFCLSKPSSGACQANESASNPRLGAELWAYVPYNLLPHLKCLKENTYNIESHKYYVDLKPSVFDVQIFDHDEDHINGWGTILVVGMRMGGSEVAAADLILPASTDQRIFGSSYVVFDVTNPEKPPKLLGEITHNTGTVDMGYTTALPVVVPIKKVASSTSKNDSEWYLVLGHGPDTFDGTSSRDAAVSVFPLKELAGGSSHQSSFRLPAAKPSGTSGPGTYTLAGSPNGFVSTPVVVDYNLDFKADAVYFGTIEGTWEDWKGKFYRFPTNTLANVPDSGISPSYWGTTLNEGPSLMYDPGRPITTAASIGWDGKDYWVYFGTGRFFDAEDKTDISSNANDTYYGLKETVNLETTVSGDVERNYLDRSDNFYDLSWSTISNTAVPGKTFSPDKGDRGLVDVTGVRVDTDGYLSCTGTGCSLTYLGTDPTLKQLEDYIVNYADGWKKDFTAYGERNLGQATLLGGLLTFTSYIPFEDICKIDGISYVHGLYYKTGTAWYMPVFGKTEGNTSPQLVVERLTLGRGLAETPNLHLSDGETGPDGFGGEGDGIKAFIQTTTGTIVEVPQESLPISNYRTGRTSWKGLSID